MAAPFPPLAGPPGCRHWLQLRLQRAALGARGPPSRAPLPPPTVPPGFAPRAPPLQPPWHCPCSSAWPTSRRSSCACLARALWAASAGARRWAECAGGVLSLVSLSLLLSLSLSLPLSLCLSLSLSSPSLPSPLPPSFERWSARKGRRRCRRAARAPPCLSTGAEAATQGAGGSGGGGGVGGGSGEPGAGRRVRGCLLYTSPSPRD